MHLFLVIMSLTLGNVFVSAEYQTDVAYSIDAFSSNDSLLELPAPTVILCMMECKENENCSYFGYHDVNRICKMYRRSTGERHETPSSEWGFYQMKDRLELTQGRQCPVGWENIGNECFYIEDSWASNWHDAQEHCRSYGGFLAEPDTHESVQKLNDIVGPKRYSGAKNWLGGSDSQTEGTWLWNSTAKQIVANDWKSDQPDGGTYENCLCLKVSQTEPTWNDVSCSYVLHIICEI